MSFLGMLQNVDRPSDNGSSPSNDTNRGDVVLSGLEEMDYFKMHPVLTIIYLTVVSLSALTGLAGNSLVISAVLVHHKLRTKTNVFITNLAIADLCVVCVVEVFNIIGLTKGSHFFMEEAWLCHAIATICIASCSCSLWTMALIAVNRYICICKRDLYEKIFNSWMKCILIVGLLWVLCALLDLPSYFNWGGHTYDPKLMTCMYDRTAHYSYTVFLVSMFMGPPLVLVVICYPRIFAEVRASKKALKRGKTAKWTKSEMQLAKTMSIILVVFLTCWTPLAALVLIDVNDNFPKVAYLVGFQLAHTNSSLNPFIYAFTNKDFRDGYKHVLCFWHKEEGSKLSSTPRDKYECKKNVSTITDITACIKY